MLTIEPREAMCSLGALKALGFGVYRNANIALRTELDQQPVLSRRRRPT